METSSICQLGLGLYSGSTGTFQTLDDTVDLTGMPYGGYPRREGSWLMYSRYWMDAYFVPGTVWKCNLLGYCPHQKLWCAMLAWEEREDVPEATRPSVRITKHAVKVFSQYRKWMDEEDRQYVVHHARVIRDMRLPKWATAMESRADGWGILQIPPFDWRAEYGTPDGERTMVENEAVRRISNSGIQSQASSSSSQSSSSRERPIRERYDMFHPTHDRRLRR